MYPSLTRFQRINLVRQQLKIQRTSFEAQWQDIAQYIVPYRLRMSITDTSRGERKNQSVLDSTATIGIRTLESGLMTSMTDPAGQWCRLTTKDRERSKYGPHREWLDRATDALFSVFNDSNVYISLPTLYGNMAAFGTAVMSVEEEFTGKCIHTRVYPTGSYWIAQDENGSVNTFYREFRWTIRQLYLHFGDQADYSTFVEDAMKNSRWNQYVDLAQIVMPNEEYDSQSAMGKDKKYYSCWFELGQYSAAGNNGDTGTGSVENKFLRESGFDEFPFLCGRWEMTEGDVYATNCPGMTQIGDVKTLQLGERRAWQAVEKMVAPHMVGPSALKGQDHGFLPNEITYLDERNEQKGLRPLYEINPRIAELQQKQEEVRGRIGRVSFTDLFKMFDSLDDRQRTATEIMERKSEKLVQLSPMSGNTTEGVLRPLVNLTWGHMVRQGVLDRMAGAPPPDLRDHPLDIQFLGVLAQAQKGSLVQPTERLVGMIEQIAAMQPNVWDKLNIDEVVDVIADRLGVPSSCVNSDEVTMAIRDQRLKAQQAQQIAAAAPQLGKAAKDLSQANLEGNSVLSKLVGMQQGRQ